MNNTLLQIKYVMNSIAHDPVIVLVNNSINLDS